jgi:hypothetical protein
VCKLYWLGQEAKAKFTILRAIFSSIFWLLTQKKFELGRKIYDFCFNQIVNSPLPPSFVRTFFWLIFHLTLFFHTSDFIVDLFVCKKSKKQHDE